MAGDVNSRHCEEPKATRQTRDIGHPACFAVLAMTKGMMASESFEATGALAPTPLFSQ